LVIAALAAMLVIDHIEGFQNFVPLAREQQRPRTTIHRNNDNKLNDTNNDNSSNDSRRPKNIFDDLKGMLRNFDDVIDDFVYKRMGAGEQWYGKRKYNPSGRVDGDYNGMGRSDYFRIEVARVQKEEMELRKQRRMEEEEEAQKKRGG
jgi:hypothetical protein